VAIQLAVLCAALALAPTAGAGGHLDRSFGKSGMVDLTAEVAENRSLGTVALAPDHGILFTEDSGPCPRSDCRYDVYLKRYRPDGSRDRSFRAGPAPVARGTQGGAWMEIDSLNRVLIAWGAEGRSVVLRRFLRDGRVDRSFGNSGTVEVDCRCSLSSLTITPGNGVLIAGQDEQGGYQRFLRMTWSFARLRPDGSFDRSFGKEGVARFFRRGYGDAAASPGPRGSAFLTGFQCCGREPSLPFLNRLSRHGQLDRDFAAASARSLRGLYGTKPGNLDWSWVTLIARAHGKVELYGAGYGRAVGIRLFGNGERDRSFGRDGVAQVSLDFASAASDGDGGTFLAGYRRGKYRVARLGPDGEVDRRFGRVVLSRAYNEEGVGILADGRGGAIVFARGESVCRQVCPSEPRMFRIVR
jgi:hypothetical protein